MLVASSALPVGRLVYGYELVDRNHSLFDESAFHMRVDNFLRNHVKQLMTLASIVPGWFTVFFLVWCVCETDEFFVASESASFWCA